MTLTAEINEPSEVCIPTTTSGETDEGFSLSFANFEGLAERGLVCAVVMWTTPEGSYQNSFKLPSAPIVGQLPSEGVVDEQSTAYLNWITEAKCPDTLSSIRHRLGLNVSQLAAVMDSSRQSIYDWMKGINQMSKDFHDRFNFLKDVANALDDSGLNELTLPQAQQLTSILMEQRTSTNLSAIKQFAKEEALKSQSASAKRKHWSKVPSKSPGTIRSNIDKIS